MIWVLRDEHPRSEKDTGHLYRHYYSQSFNDMYSILAPYALHFASAVLPVDTSSKTFGTPVTSSTANADADADHNFQDLGAVLYINKTGVRGRSAGAPRSAGGKTTLQK